MSEATFLPLEHMPKSEQPTAVLNKIMTAEEYGQMEHETPYLYRLRPENGDMELFYFGVGHSSNPDDPMFSSIESEFERMKPDLILVEGIGNLPEKRAAYEQSEHKLSRDEIIRNYGESGFALNLAIQAGIACESPEPKDSEMYQALLEQGFSRENIFAQQVLLILPQYHRQIERGGFREYARPHIDNFKKSTDWNDFDYSYENAIRICEGVLGKKINVETESQPIEYVDPIPWNDRKDTQTIFNEISRATTIFRDRFMVARVAELVRTYKKIFVVFGGSHAVMQEPALRELMGELTL